MLLLFVFGGVRVLAVIGGADGVLYMIGLVGVVGRGVVGTITILIVILAGLVIIDITIIDILLTMLPRSFSNFNIYYCHCAFSL